MTSTAENIMQFPEKSRYKPETAEAFDALSGDAPQWVQELRQRGLEQVKRMGLPTPKLERWKYTNLIPHVRDFGTALGGADVVYNDPDNLVQKLGEVIENAPEWLMELMSADPAAEDRYHDMALWHLCNAYLRDGLVIDVPEGKIANKPVEITIKGHDNNFFVPRTVFRLGAGAELTIIEHHTGEGRYWNNYLTQIIVGPNAKLRHYRIQENSLEAVYTQNTQVRVERDGLYEGFTLCEGDAMNRNQFHGVLVDENATCNIFGINTLRGNQHSDTTAEIEHQAPHCNSRQFIRSVLDDQARGVFQGKVYVHEGADKTDGTQMSNALLMAEGAEMDTKPELEIYADDVQCAHGATTGKLEDEPLFYLRSRGLPEQEARMLLVEAFVGEVVDNLGDEAVRDMVYQKVQKWLS